MSNQVASSGNQTYLHPSAVEVHERTSLLFSCSHDGRLTARLNTLTGFSHTPEVILQSESGSLTQITAVHPVTSANGRVIYDASFVLTTAYLEASLIVKGTARSGIKTSAVEGFVAIRLSEGGQYDVFGPRGGMFIKLDVTKREKDCDCPEKGKHDEINRSKPDQKNTDQWSAPVVVVITGSPKELPPSLDGAVPISEAFTICVEDGQPSKRPLNARFALSLGSKAPEAVSDEDAILYRWDQHADKWLPVDERCRASVTNAYVEGKVESGGTYAVFMKQRLRGIKELTLECDQLKQMVFEQARQLKRYRNILAHGLLSGIWSQGGLESRQSVSSTSEELDQTSDGIPFSVAFNSTPRRNNSYW